MQFIKRHALIILPAFFTLLGFLTLKFSVNLGTSSANAYLRSTGGGMGSTEFYTI